MSTAPPLLSPALVDVLVSGRARFNARVAETRHRHPAFDTAAFASFVATGVDSVARSVHAVAPERTGLAVQVAYDIALDLVAQGLAGPAARSGVIEATWTTLAPRYATLMAHEPMAVLGALSNAALQVSAVPGARAPDWFAGMAQVAGLTQTVAQLQSVGVVIAWRCGLAHFRGTALDTAATLPIELVRLALGLEDGRDWPALRAGFDSHPWWSPTGAGADSQGIEIGSFTGFGGSFAQPPSVRAGATGFLVRSGDRYSLLVADGYGAVLLPATGQEFDDAERTTRLPGVEFSGGHLVVGDRTFACDLPESGFELVGNAHTVALTSRYSHAIRLLPRQRVPA